MHLNETQASAPVKQRRLRWVLALLALALLAIAGYLRLWQLGQVPGFFHFDEGNNAADALDVLAGKHAVFFPANRGREGLIIYGVAGFTALLGRSMLAARLTGALSSTLAVVAVFWLGSVIFGRLHGQYQQDRWSWRGYAIGALGAGIMAVSLGLAILGRTGLRANFLPLMLPLAVGLLWTGVGGRSSWRLALAGFVTGMLAYTYISARLFPLFLLLFAVSFYLPGVEGYRPDWRAYWRGLALYGGVALVTALPMLVHYVQHPGDFSSRSVEVWLFNSQLYDGNPISTLIHNIWLQLSVLGFAGDPSWRSNYAELPLLNPLEALFFWLGAGALLAHWRRAYSRLLLLWLAVFLVPAVLSYDLPRNTFRMLAMAPAISLTLGYGLWLAASWLAGLADRRSSHASRAVLAALLALAVLSVVARGVVSADLLFNRWSHEVEANVAAPNVEWIDMQELAAREPVGVAYVVPISEVGEYATSSFHYLYQGDTPVHMLDSSKPDFVGQLYQALVDDGRTQPLKSVAAVDWDREAVADAPQRIPFLLNKYGRWLANEQRKYYRIDRYGELNTTRPWQLYKELESLQITLDGGISLTGIAAGKHSGEQVTTQAGAAFKPGSEPGWLVLRWQADQPPKGNYRLSLRLIDSMGASAWQQDSSLVDDLNQPTGKWQQGQVAESYHTLALPGDLPAGDYRLQAIVYDETTLTPIVQVGIWTPEIALAKVEQ